MRREGLVLAKAVVAAGLRIIVIATIFATLITTVVLTRTIFAILLFTYTALGIVARTVPQINIFVVGFPLTIAVGLLALGLALPHIAMLIRGVFGQLGYDILIVLGAM